MSAKRIKELQKRLREIDELEALATGLPQHQIKILKRAQYLDDLSKLGGSYDRVVSTAEFPYPDRPPVLPVPKVQDDSDDWKEVKPKRPQNGSSSSSKPSQPTYLPISLTELIRTKPDGSCLFQALSQYIPCSPLQIRARICHFISHNSSLSVGGFTLREWISTETGETVKEYVERLGQPNTWGGQVELFACSMEFSCSVRVWTPFDEKRFILLYEFDGGNSRICHVLFDGVDHYDAVTLKRDVVAKMERDAKERIERGLRRP